MSVAGTDQVLPSSALCTAVAAQPEQAATTATPVLIDPSAVGAG